MPKRRRTVFVPKKKPTRQYKLVGGDPAAPTEAEWSTLKEFGSFIVRDEDGEEHVFKKGDVATILPPHIPVGKALELHEYWVAKIREVRARGDEDVWTRVQWYWSGTEVKGVIKSFDADSCGRYERIFSDHYDFVSTSTYNGVVPMMKLNDHILDQPYIDQETFYTRYTFEYKARVIDPKPGTTSCTCLNPYNPDDTTTLMHFCPRPTCRRFYHSSCLTKSKSRDKPPSLRLLSSSPDSDSPIDLETLAPAEPPSKRRRSRSSAVQLQNTHALRKTTATLLAQLPDELVRIAEQPIVRGAAFVQGGVSGNVRVVVNARRMVYEAIQGGRGVQDGWEEEMGIRGLEEEDGMDQAVVKVGTNTRKQAVSEFLQPWLCPNCGGPI